jgi:hypothetical protein
MSSTADRSNAAAVMTHRTQMGFAAIVRATTAFGEAGSGVLGSGLAKSCDNVRSSSRNRATFAGSRLIEDDAVDRIKRSLPGVTDCFLFCQGWLSEPGEARHEAARFFAVLDGALAPLRDRVVPLRIALHWPSKPFGETGTARAGLDGVMWPDLEVHVFERARDRRAPISPLLADLCGVEVPRCPEEQLELDRLVRRLRDPESRGTLSLDLFRALSFWVMKRRAGEVGERLGREVLAPLWDNLACAGRPRLHLIGHSFGAKLMTSAVLGGVRPQSLTLLLATFSSFAFSPDIPNFDRSGGYRRVLEEEQVRGPIVVVRSSHDRALRLLCSTVTAGGQADGDESPGPADGGVPVPRLGKRRGYMWDVVATSALGAVGARGVGAPEVDLLEAQMIGLPRQPVVNVDGSQVVDADDAQLGAHLDIYHPEIATLILLAAGLLEGSPEGARPKRLTSFARV